MILPSFHSSLRITWNDLKRMPFWVDIHISFNWLYSTKHIIAIFIEFHHEIIQCRSFWRHQMYSYCKIIKYFETKSRKSHQNQRRNNGIVRFTIAFSIGHMCYNAFFQCIFIVPIVQWFAIKTVAIWISIRTNVSIWKLQSRFRTTDWMTLIFDC